MYWEPAHPNLSGVTGFGGDDLPELGTAINQAFEAAEALDRVLPPEEFATTDVGAEVDRGVAELRRLFPDAESTYPRDKSRGLVDSQARC